MSGASNHTIEDAAKIAPKNAWYQLYAARDGGISEDLIRRTADAGLGALVLTVDDARCIRSASATRATALPTSAATG